MQSTLEFKNICMEFPGVKALDDMSFQAEGGEVLAFLGENGAGKSTLFKILNGDYHPTSELMEFIKDKKEIPADYRIKATMVTKDNYKEVMGAAAN